MHKNANSVIFTRKALKRGPFLLSMIKKLAGGARKELQ
tara:strand:- start:634 stop:747 length:114 start_codon:yes stop_codon:yes gene_type:complete